MIHAPDFPAFLKSAEQAFQTVHLAKSLRGCLPSVRKPDPPWAGESPTSSPWPDDGRPAQPARHRPLANSRPHHAGNVNASPVFPRDSRQTCGSRKNRMPKTTVRITGNTTTARKAAGPPLCIINASHFRQHYRRQRSIPAPPISARPRAPVRGQRPRRSRASSAKNSRRRWQRPWRPEMSAHAPWAKLRQNKPRPEKTAEKKQHAGRRNFMHNGPRKLPTHRHQAVNPNQHQNTRNTGRRGQNILESTGWAPTRSKPSATYTQT